MVNGIMKLIEYRDIRHFHLLCLWGTTQIQAKRP